MSTTSKPLLRAVVAPALAAACALSATEAGAATTELWAVAFKQSSGLPANVDRIVARAGGTIVVRLPEIGGIGVESSNPSFANHVMRNSSVMAADVAVTMTLFDRRATGAGDHRADDHDADDHDAGDHDAGDHDACDHDDDTMPTGSDDQRMPDPLGFEQWDKKRINASLDGSYAVQRGRSDVRVFVIDTGADVNHVDVAPNLDLAKSISFVPHEPTIQDFNGHGTWTISAVGAPINGVGISGVAPNVTLVAGKVLDETGFGSFLYTAQALVYAGLERFDIVSASLGGYIPKCKVRRRTTQDCDSPAYILLHRATQFARANGVLPVGALGNDGLDLADERILGNLIVAPAGLEGWVGVSATGYDDGKAFYSNYGTGVVDVAAPGGSTRDYSGEPGSAKCDDHGGDCRLIGAWSSTSSDIPEDTVEQCTGPDGTPPCYLYAYVQGTSMATPNAAGVAALIISEYGDFSRRRSAVHLWPTQVESILEITANNQACPTPNTVIQGPEFLVPTATCRGSARYNNFFGHGIVDALSAVTFRDH